MRQFPSDAVLAFQGEFRFLSNFFPAPVRLGGIVWPCVEHAFVAAKTTDSDERARVLACRTPGEAKRLGRTLTLRPGWDELRLEVMLGLVRQKFRAGRPLAARLLATEGAPRRGQCVGGRVLGVDARTGCGENHLGRLLMQVQDELRR